MCLELAFLPGSIPHRCGYLPKTCVWAGWSLAAPAHGGLRKTRRKDRRDRRNGKKVWKVGRGAWKEAWWAWRPGEAGRMHQTGNERGGGRKEMDRARANGMDLKRGMDK